MLEKLPHGLPLHHSGIDGTHLQRFHKDPQEPLTAYGVFHGDDRLPFGEPVPTGSLRRSTRTLPSLTLTHTQNASPSGPGVYHTFSGGPPKDAYTIRPTMSLQSLLKDDGSSAASPTRTLGGTLGKTATSTTYQYATGTFTSTSGLPPTQYKSWTSEYGDEYRGPKERKEIREQLTMRHGTADALKTGRYQFQGYPYDASNPAFRTYVPSSLTERGQVMPNYESRLKSF